MTTIDHVPGYRVTRVIGAVLGLTLRVNDKYSEGIKDLQGHGGTRLSQLVATRQEAVERMTAYAGQLGANAVIGSVSTFATSPGPSTRSWPTVPGW